MVDNPHSLWHPTTKAGRTVLGRALYQLETADNLRRPGGPVNIELGPIGKKFVAMGLLLLGIRLAPSVGASGEAWIIPGLFLALGAYGMIIGLIEGWGFGWYPFEETSGFRGRCWQFLWALRPRIWMLVWVVIILVFINYGSPHLRIQYNPSGCDYFGLNGWESYGVSGSCPLVKNFRLC